MISIDEIIRNNNNSKSDIMGEIELEEGEACSYHHDFDPDIALSYLDEKVEHVLGHLMKDFEGVVSAENLGAKYGTYGSFLPSHRRSPILSHSRSPQTVQNYSTPSLSISNAEGGHRNSSVQVNVPNSMKNGSLSSGTASLYKPPPQRDHGVQAVKTQSSRSVGVCTPKSEVRNQRTFKLRIKVGSDNLIVKKNTDIYNGLGLDGSPSPSFDDRSVECGGLSGTLHSDSHDSPTQILLVMTSSPLLGGYLLSPLPDHLLQLSERPRLMQDSKTSSVKKDSENIHLGFDTSEKETDVDAFSYEELISSALKLPLLSQADVTLEGSTKVSSKETVYSDAPKREHQETMLFPVSAIDRANEKANSLGNVVNHAGVEAHKEMMTNSRKNSRNKGDTAHSSTKADLLSSKSKKGSNSGRKDPLKPKSEKSTGHDGGLQMSSEDKKLQKSDVSGSSTRKLAMGSVSDIEHEKSLRQKTLGNTSDTYKDFFGDINEEADDSPHLSSGDKMKTCDIAEKADLTNEKSSKDRRSSSVAHVEAIPGANMRVTSHNTSFSEHGHPVSEPAHGGVDTKDNWVCCDKCLKWRLLPPGKEDNLPEKWLCSMMTWLPGMNRCSISEEETNKAFRARYPLAAENPVSLHVPLDDLYTGTRPTANLSTIAANDGKLIDKVRKTSNPSYQDSPNRAPSSMKKKQQDAKDRTLTEAKVSPSMNGLGLQQLSKSRETYVETNEPKKSHEHRADHDYDGGRTKMSKTKSKRLPDQEFPRTSKKSKSRITPNGDIDCPPARDLDNEMLTVHSGYGTHGKSRSQVEEFQDDPGPSSIAPKKRKKDNSQGPESLNPSSSKVTPYSDRLNSKKHRVSKSTEKESSASKRDGKGDKRVRGISHHSLDGIESIRKSSSNAHSVVATTSSSSKTSNSLKEKSKHPELKGSPVESVSSSPLKNSNGDKMMSARKIMMNRDNAHNADKLTSSSTKYLDDDHACGNDQYISRRNDMVGTSKDSPGLFKDKDDKPSAQKGLVKMSDSFDNQLSHAPVYEEKEKNSKVKVQDKFGSFSDKAEKDATFNNQEISAPKCKAQEDYIKKLPKKVGIEKNENLPTCSSEKLRQLTPSDVKNETSNYLQPILGNGLNTSTSDAQFSGSPKEPHRNKKDDSQNTPSKNRVSNGQRFNNLDAPSPLRRVASSNQAANSAYKEAKDLKHLADRLKIAGSAESTAMYFEAALKFLHTASLLESGNAENAKHGDATQSVKIYGSTAKLCEFCAHEFEKSKDMATAALAYKCMEVAYLRVIYSSHHSAGRDRLELQTVLQMVPPGESPSSSASDIDNLNHSAGDKALQVRNAGSPQITSNLVISARNRPNFSRLLSFAQDVSFAMEASRKSRVAFAAANSSMASVDYKDVIASIKSALDFNFHDVEGLLHLVRLAKEASSR